MDVVDAQVHLTHGIVRKIGVDDPLLQSEFSSIRRNLEHIIDRRVNRSGVNFCCTFRQFRHHRLLNFRRLRHNIMVNRRRRG